jgi:hypothetical protein
LTTDRVKYNSNLDKDLEICAIDKHKEKRQRITSSFIDSS